MKKLILTVFIILALVFLALGIYYFLTPAGSLPHYFPGYLANSSHKHAKHGLASLVIAIGFGILAWFYSAKKDLDHTTKTTE
jgi:hypothetical protein